MAHGEYDRVYVDAEDVPAMLGALGVSLEEFERDYCWFEEGFRLLRFVSGACPFLTDQGCRVYAARPVQCRTWPFWRDNLRRKIWQKEVKPFCPGIGKGRRYTQQEIEELAGEMEAN